MYQQIELEAAIQSLRKRRGTPPPDTARFTIEMTRLIAKGEPVTVEMLAEATDFPLESVQNAFEQMRSGNAEFDGTGNLRGYALTQLPTPHQFRVNGQALYAWCALDTLFLPAYLDAAAEITSECPMTGTSIQLIVSPEGVQFCSPQDVALSIVIPDLVGDTCNTRDGFCGQIYFFASQDVAEQWAEHRPGIAIFSLSDAYQIAQEVYIKPFLQA
ncbi:MAG: alkylmercury lyase MerB [Chloroflexi bacterium]|nr:alkylmercury lyase MerB [Chloroflexota bacterium]